MAELLQPPLNILGGSHQLLQDSESSPRHQRAAPQVNVLAEPPEEKLFQGGQSVMLAVELLQDGEILEGT